MYRIVAEEVEEVSVARRKRQVDSSTNTTSSVTTITLEFGDPPVVNISTPSAPSIAMDIQLAGEVNDSVDIEVSMFHTIYFARNTNYFSIILELCII